MKPLAFSVADVMLSALISFISDRLSASEFLNFARKEQFLFQLNVWENLLPKINALLHDALQSHNASHGLRLWLSDLRDLAYDAEDIIDEIDTQFGTTSKDYEFDKNDLVLLWMAEGLIQQAKGEKQMQDIGLTYFHDLVSMSFFQHSSRNRKLFVMHDLINDVAQFVAGEMCLHFEDTFEDKPHAFPAKLRHLSFTCHQYEISKRFKALDHMESLRTFIALPMDTSSQAAQYYISNKVLQELLAKFRYLRLPESVGKLFNLQTLLLRGYRKLTKLPQGELSITGLENVVNVRDARDANLMDKHGIDGLYLKWGSEFLDHQKEEGDPSFTNIVHMSLNNCSKSMSLPSLGRLPLLKKLFIRGMNGVKKVGLEFYGDGLPSTERFLSLEILWFHNMLEWEHWSSTHKGDEDLADEFPSLHELLIQNCPKLAGGLPRCLPSLVKLIISRCPKDLACLPQEMLESLGALQTFDVPDDKCLLPPTLTSIVISKLNNMESLSTELQNLTSLEGLEVSDCPKLHELPREGMLAKLGKLCTRNCQLLQQCLEKKVAYWPLKAASLA
ncbi:hypothetical protein SLEP1_g23762 [Rubroshorea leprosula]|uniref:Rx N-terminal domain-containing protein n=1 Tax=Rubroshorea leprosula TaxID=152421 RepID=A0AAV5JQI4_9ROSI|nr:hypothetical protein SLEP1_g23762 [Rubroshorea leprosula]